MRQVLYTAILSLFTIMANAQVALKTLTTVATLGGKHWQKALVTCLFGLLLNTMQFHQATLIHARIGEVAFGTAAG